MTQNHHATGVSGACPDVDTLADLHAGVLDDRTARSLREHVSSCAACTEVLAALDATVASLAAMPHVQIPADVAARIDRAIATESGRIGLSDDLTTSLAASPPAAPSTVRQLHPGGPRPAPTQTTESVTGGSQVVSLAAHREKRAGRGRWLLAAAAAAAVVGIGGVVIAQNAGDDTASTQADKQQDSQDDNAGAPQAGGGAQAFSSPKDVLERGAIENDQVSPQVAGKMAELSERNKCLSQIVPRPASAPEAVQAGTHDGVDAYAFVFPTKDQDVVTMVVVEAANCSNILDEVEGPRQ